LHKPKAEGVSFVDDIANDHLWSELMEYFTLPPEEDPKAKMIEGKVKAWALKKMAKQFKNHKKILYHDYILKKKTPEFTGANEKIKDH
jgi:hypothetical protein